jgi:hypothetical protein
MGAKTLLDELYSDEEVERRATEALRRALTTLHKPQNKIAGKTPGAKARKRAAAKARPASA